MIRAYCVASRSSCSGRTFDGPQPKRPSAGRRSWGISSTVLVVMAMVLAVAAVVRTDAQACGADFSIAPRWCAPPELTPVATARRSLAGPPGRDLLVEVRVDPVHHRAQLLAGRLDLRGGLLGAHALEVLLAGAVLGDPLAGEVARLDLGEDLLHARPRVVGDDALAARVVAVLGGVGDRVAHPRQA